MRQKNYISLNYKPLHESVQRQQKHSQDMVNTISNSGKSGVTNRIDDGINDEASSSG